MLSVKRLKKINPKIYQEISTLWEKTGINKPERKDSFESIQENLQQTGILIIAEENDKIIGVVWVTNDFRRLYIHHMAVVPNKQNQGIGTKLMEECISLANEYGYQLKLEVNIDNPAAWHLYEKFGFKELSGYRILIKRDI
ncbi:MAG TPA: GNAT family N-acetyltransferase [Candidatus Cloacimonas sp.]|nr:GNAT family N-acetyltransferase [Candidatus Cloacimonas sp.]